MKKLSTFLVLFFLISNLNSFSKDVDTLYIKINELDVKYKRFLLNEKVDFSVISILIKNKFQESLLFVSNPYEPSIQTLEKNISDKLNLMSFYTYNSYLKKDFLNTVYNNVVFLIITEDKLSYYMIKVKPILPKELNNM